MEDQNIKKKVFESEDQNIKKWKTLLWMSEPMAKDHNAKKLPTMTNLQNMCCLSPNNTPWLCSKSKNRQQPEHSKLWMFIKKYSCRRKCDTSISIWQV